MRDFTLKKYAVPEVVLLGILVAGLVISHSIVLDRSDIKLSSPHEVPASGFSFSMPKGGAWQIMPYLRFAQNSWYLTGVQSSDGKSSTRLTVSYLLAGGRPDPNEWLASRAGQLGQRLGATQIIEGTNTVMCAAVINLRRQGLNIFYGIALLPDGRSVIIEMIDNTEDSQWGWEVLNRVGGSFAFAGNPPLEEGKKVVASLRSSGLGSVLGVSEHNEYFLITAEDHPDGFQADMYAHTADETAMNVRTVNSYYLQSAGGREGILQTNDRFDRFLWINNALSSIGMRRPTGEMQYDGQTLTVRQEGSRFVQTYVPGPAAVPEPFSIAAFRQMTADGTNKALIDFINSEGQIMPGVVEIEKAPADSNSGTAHIIKVKYFTEAEISEEIRLDAQGRMIEDIVSGQTSYVLSRAGKDIILNEFPQWLDYITNLENLLKEDIPDRNKTPKRIIRNDGTII